MACSPKLSVKAPSRCMIQDWDSHHDGSVTILKVVLVCAYGLEQD